MTTALTEFEVKTLLHNQSQRWTVHLFTPDSSRVAKEIQDAGCLPMRWAASRDLLTAVYDAGCNRNEWLVLTVIKSPISRDWWGFHIKRV